jgi:hypothetical protein
MKKSRVYTRKERKSPIVLTGTITRIKKIEKSGDIRKYVKRKNTKNDCTAQKDHDSKKETDTHRV